MAKKESSTSREIGPDLRPIKSTKEAAKRKEALSDKELRKDLGGDAQYMQKLVNYPDKYDEVGASENYKKGGSVKSKASKRADGCCVRGKTRA